MLKDMPSPAIGGSEVVSVAVVIRDLLSLPVEGVVRADALNLKDCRSGNENNRNCDVTSGVDPTSTFAANREADGWAAVVDVV